MRVMVLLGLLGACTPEPTRVSLFTTESVPFVVFADGDGSWRFVSASRPGFYEYEVHSDRWGVAWTCDTMAAAVLLTIDEATAIAEPCIESPRTTSLAGEVSGLLDGQQARVTASTGGVDFLSSADPAFDLEVPADQELDLAVQVLDAEAMEAHVLVERGLSQADSPRAYDVADMTPMVRRGATPTGDVVGPALGSSLVTTTGRVSWVGGGSSGGVLLVPKSLLEPDDLQVVTAHEPGIVDGDGRMVEAWMHVPQDHELPFPERPVPPEIATVAVRGGVHVRATMPTGDVDAYHLLAFQQEFEPPYPFAPVHALIVTRGWLEGADPVELMFPLLEDRVGWPDELALTTAGLRWQLFLRRSSGPVAAVLPGHHPQPIGGGVAWRSYAATAGFVD